MPEGLKRPLEKITADPVHFRAIPEELCKVPESDKPAWETESGSIRDAYGDSIADTIDDIVEGPDKDVQELWKKYKDEILIADSDYDGWSAWFDTETGAVTIDIEKCRSGDAIASPYQAAFHEFGHNIDQKINKRLNNDDGRLMSETYKDGLLGKTAKAEAAKFIENYRSAMEAKEGRAISYEEACEAISGELMEKLPLKERGDLSDIFEGATDGAIRLGVGHGKDYWKHTDNGVEIFAEIFSASICNKGSLSAIKKYFPETYKVFKEIVEAANEQA